MHPLRSKFLQYFTHIYLLLIFHLFVWLYPFLFLNHRRIIPRFNFTIYFRTSIYYKLTLLLIGITNSLLSPSFPWSQDLTLPFYHTNILSGFYLLLPYTSYLNHHFLLFFHLPKIPRSKCTTIPRQLSFIYINIYCHVHILYITHSLLCQQVSILIIKDFTLHYYN